MEYTEKDHEEYLDDIFGEVSICGMSYGAGYALKEIDLIAFSVSYSDRLAELEDEDEE